MIILHDPDIDVMVEINEDNRHFSTAQRALLMASRILIQPLQGVTIYQLVM